MRNLVLIPSLIVLIGIVFIFGLTVGVYKIFPYEILDSSLDAIKEEAPTENNQFITQSDLNTLVRIDGKSDIEKKRNDLTKFFWSVGSLQHSDHITFRPQLPEVESDISDFRYNNFQNLKQIDKLTIEMEYGINSVSYLLLPEESNEKLILYHHGHDGDFLLGKDTIHFFLKRNFNARIVKKTS